MEEFKPLGEDGGRERDGLKPTLEERFFSGGCFEFNVVHDI